MKLVETLEAEFQIPLQTALAPDEEILLQVYADLNPDGSFGRQWLVVTRDRILYFVPGAPDLPQVISLDKITRAHTEALVGGGRLQIERSDGPTLLIPYSSSLGDKFSEVARGLEQLRQGQAFLINPHLDRIRCDKCQRLLPEKNGICPACISRLATIGRISSYLKPYKLQAIVLALASVIATAGELLPPLITARLVDDVLVPKGDQIPSAQDRLTMLAWLVLALVGIRVFTWIGEWVHGWIVTWLAPQITTHIRSELYRRLEMLSLQFYDKRPVGGLISRVSRDAEMLQDFLVDGLPYLITNTMMLLGILGFLFYISWDLGLYILMPVPLMILWGALYWNKLRRYFNKWGQAWSDMTDRTSEALTGISVVKAFAQEKREMEAFGKINNRVKDVAIKTSIHRGVFFGIITFLTGLGTLVVWFFGGQKVINETLSLGILLAFFQYMWMVYGPMEWFGMVNSWMTRAFAGAERIFEVIDTKPESYEDPNSVAMPQLEGRVKFTNTTFGYDKSKPVLHDISLEVEPGEMIGLVGKSGVGKTTTINLIARFYDADHGTIEIDGVDIRNIRLSDLRSQIGIVMQEPVLFSGTIGENIEYGKPGASFAEIMGAARAANAHNFIMAKPDGYDTQVGERGNNLSGGERQRVSIARAVLHAPKILILDEATSAVDVETEKQIQVAINQMVKGRTTFAVAHRLSTLRNADRLVVIESGRIIEIGSHAELMAKKGAFYDLVKLQEEVAQIIAIKE